MDASNRVAGSGWFPLCGVDALDDRAIHRTELLGHDLVAWRADDGTVNVWENRCPHRGVRLSIGQHRGDALQCQYHGWQFGSGGGACRFVPAHPSAAAPKVDVRTWPAKVRHGFVWSCVVANGELPPFEPVADLDGAGDRLRLRTVAIDAGRAAVMRALGGYRFDPAGLDTTPAGECAAFELTPDAVLVEHLESSAQVVFLVQPARADRTYLHGVALGDIAADGDALAMRRHHQQRLNRLRDALEARSAAAPKPSFPASVTVQHGMGAAYRRESPLPATPVFEAKGETRPVSTAAGAGTDATDDRAFRVHLARSGLTVEVAADASLLHALREHGIDVPTSCEQGVCGTCRTRVLDGVPQHRDGFLTPDEQRAGDCMMVCVSRAATGTLTLDL
ncbi:vanillate O-demethylase ferredoxin subunit [Paraburkholderia caballeronis]|uniref:Rieske 2Fe-2S domain-containing protein n=1 Tax=Paraburkholderia caballeronis TaxID=416943 RepID=UPI0010E2D7D7|nr:Rieske 2Fe-2S domain-containing protein [Paraburkholderia caballeronis]TDV27287.1 vanillate O-demethylase ferredoxin subunit [Paraburkholderia caballeronis]